MRYDSPKSIVHGEVKSESEKWKMKVKYFFFFFGSLEFVELLYVKGGVIT